MKQLGELTVADYMTPQAICIEQHSRLTKAIEIMDDQQVSVLPVVDGEGGLVGILSATDLIEITHEIQADLSGLSKAAPRTRAFLIRLLMDQGDTTLVHDVMTSGVETTTPQTNLVVAAQKLTDCDYHHLPVMGESGEPIGILATSDLVRAMADYGAMMAGP